MTSWQCLRLRAALVDFAEGTLGEPARRRVERHLASCPRCSAAVLELREARGRLEHMAPPDPPREFWARQRDAVLRAIEEPAVAARSRPVVARSRARRWGTPLALAASLALALLASRWWSPSGDSTRVAVRSTAPTAQNESVAEATAAAVGDEPSLLAQDALAFEDTSLLGLAEQLQDDSTSSVDDDLI